MTQPRETHGLAELARRRGWRRLEDARRGDVYLSERTSFRDSATGCLVWRMTADPAVDAGDYYDIPSWNADGSVMSFLSRRTGKRARWMMDANGAKIRPMPTSGGEMIETGYWSIVHRDRFYHPVLEDGVTVVMALNPFTGEQQVIVRADRDLGAMMPPHAAEESFLFGRKEEGSDPALNDTPSFICVLALDGTVQELELERRWHRLRFTKSADLRIFFNYDNPRTQWTILPNGSERQEIPYTGGHPDWLPDGSELSYYAEGAIWGVRYDGSERREIVRLGSGGHGGPTLDGDYMVSDTHGGEAPRYPNAILYLRTDGSGVVHRIATPMSSFYAHSERWHPDHHTTHPHPVASPDGTKTLFNSDMLGEFSDVYVAVNRFPEPPTNTRARLDGRSVVLNWDPPVRARELNGYNVYRFDEGATDWKQLTYLPQKGLGWRGPQRKEPAFYVVTAVEHSGLESRPSNVVFQFGNEVWEGYARLTYEAEAGTLAAPMREALDMVGASNGYYVECPAGGAGGNVTISASLPKSGPYRVWARTRGQGALAVTIDGRAQGNAPCSGGDWAWVAVGEAVTLMSGARGLVFTATAGGECLDKVVITDDAEYTPEGTLELDALPPAAPAEVVVEPVSPNTLKVAWKALTQNDLAHYNVYCGTEPEFEPSVETLVGSPLEAEFVDWGLQPGQTYYYRVTAVDRWRNESEPGEAVEDALEPFTPHSVLLEARQAQRQGLNLVDAQAAGALTSGGRVLQGGESARATWKFKLDAGGEFAIWGRSLHRQGRPTRFEVRLDDEPLGEWQVWGRWDQLVWSPVGTQVTGTPERFSIAEGRHTLQIVALTPDALLGDVLITDDPTWWPVEGFKKG